MWSRKMEFNLISRNTDDVFPRCFVKRQIGNCYKKFFQENSTAKANLNLFKLEFAHCFLLCSVLENFQSRRIRLVV